MAGNRTRVNCLEGSYAHHYTTIATAGGEKASRFARRSKREDEVGAEKTKEVHQEEKRTEGKRFDISVIKALDIPVINMHRFY